MPDLVLLVRFGPEQDPHAQLAVVVGGADMVRCKRAWRLVVPLPAQRDYDRRPKSLHVRVRLHEQDRLLNKSLAHDTSMQIGSLANSLI